MTTVNKAVRFLVSRHMLALLLSLSGISGLLAQEGVAAAAPQENRLWFYPPKGPVRWRNASWDSHQRVIQSGSGAPILSVTFNANGGLAFRTPRSVDLAPYNRLVIVCRSMSQLNPELMSQLDPGLRVSANRCEDPEHERPEKGGIQITIWENDSANPGWKKATIRLRDLDLERPDPCGSSLLKFNFMDDTDTSNMTVEFKAIYLVGQGGVPVSPGAPNPVVIQRPPPPPPPTPEDRTLRNIIAVFLGIIVVMVVRHLLRGSGSNSKYK